MVIYRSRAVEAHHHQRERQRQPPFPLIPGLIEWPVLLPCHPPELLSVCIYQPALLRLLLLIPMLILMFLTRHELWSIPESAIVVLSPATTITLCLDRATDAIIARRMKSARQTSDWPRDRLNNKRRLRGDDGMWRHFLWGYDSDLNCSCCCWWLCGTEKEIKGLTIGTIFLLVVFDLI